MNKPQHSRPQLLDVRVATGLLQGGFSVALKETVNTDIFSVELLTADGGPLGVADAARLRARDLKGQGLVTGACITRYRAVLTACGSVTNGSLNATLDK